MSLSSENVKLLAFAGSARRASLNKQLVQAAARMADTAEITVIDLADFPMPLYDGDLEEREGLPASVARLKALLSEHDGLLLACPEYNSSITPLMKNVIDWCSRPAAEDEPPLSAFRGKVAGLLAASPGGLGGMRGLRHVREILGNIGVTVVPQQFALGSAFKAFNEDGTLADEGAANGVREVVEALIRTTSALVAAR